MIRNLRFRWKLAVMVGVPLVALVLVAIPGVVDRVQVVRDETRAGRLDPAAAAAARLVVALQDENALSNRYLPTGDGAVVPALDAARRRTDDRVRAVRSAVGSVRGAGAPVAARRLSDLLEGLALVGQQRRFVDLRVIPIDSITGFYQEATAEALGALDAMATSLHDATAAANRRDATSVVQIENAAGKERAILTGGFAQASLDDGLFNDFVATVSAQDTLRAAFDAGAAPTLRRAYDARLRAGRSVIDEVRALRSVALARRFSGGGATAGQWYDSASRQMAVLASGGEVVASKTHQIDVDRADRARLQLAGFGGAVLAALAISVALAIVVARATTRPLERLTRAARTLTAERLPRLVEALHGGGEGGAEAAIADLQPVRVRSKDEIGDLARAFNDLESTTAEVAREQQRVVRTGIGELYVHLARRNQALVTRQIEVIDELEADEQEAGRLTALFRLDHLATRMRRNAESLLVLAGADPVRPRGSPIPLVDVVRAAASEIADYQRVEVVDVDPAAAVPAELAPDLAHALAELLENATAFSAPDSTVVVRGRGDDGDEYELTIVDTGIGFSPDALRETNRVLAHPPLPGLRVGRQLGLVVVARLASRLGARVDLRSEYLVGTTASVRLPAGLLVGGDGPNEVDLRAPELQDASGPGAVTTDRGDSPSVLVNPPAGSGPADDLLPPRTSDRVPADAPAAPISLEDPAPESRAAPDPAVVTAAGLPRRTRPDTTAADRARRRPAPAAQAPSSPDEVFELLARFEAGHRRVAVAGDPGRGEPGVSDAAAETGDEEGS